MLVKWTGIAREIHLIFVTGVAMKHEFALHWYSSSLQLLSLSPVRSRTTTLVPSGPGPHPGFVPVSSGASPQCWSLGVGSGSAAGRHLWRQIEPGLVPSDPPAAAELGRKTAVGSRPCRPLPGDVWVPGPTPQSCWPSVPSHQSATHRADRASQ